MRTITIKRTKSFVGCAGTMKVYIEDTEANELLINGLPCRKLGTLKNGEEKQFDIGEQEAKIFVIADKLTKNYCNEFYKLPVGSEDIVLSGKNHFNPGAGNPFQFDGQTDPEVLKNRKKGTVKGSLVLVAAVFVGLVVGVLAGRMFTKDVRKDVEAKTFSSNGMTITLTDGFWEAEFEGYTVSFASKKVSVFAMQEAFDLVPGFGDYTLEEYGQLVLQANGLSTSTSLQKKDGLTYFEFERNVSEKLGDYYYLAVVYKAHDAFWLVQFSTQVGYKDVFKGDFLEWAKTVEFTKGNPYA